MTTQASGNREPTPGTLLTSRLLGLIIEHHTHTVFLATIRLDSTDEWSRKNGRSDVAALSAIEDALRVAGECRVADELEAASISVRAKAAKSAWPHPLTEAA